MSAAVVATTSTTDHEAGRGHALTIDGGWQEVADTALAFLRRFA
jgi:hypothetical protein